MIRFEWRPSSLEIKGFARGACGARAPPATRAPKSNYVIGRRRRQRTTRQQTATTSFGLSADKLQTIFIQTCRARPHARPPPEPGACVIWARAHARPAYSMQMNAITRPYVCQSGWRAPASP